MPQPRPGGCSLRPTPCPQHRAYEVQKKQPHAHRGPMLVSLEWQGLSLSWPLLRQEERRGEAQA